MSAKWLEVQGKVLSDLGRDVARILGVVYDGIYHISSAALHKRVEWSNECVICIVVRGELSSHDADALWPLVTLCADCGIRLAISARAPGYLQLQFTRGDHLWCGRLRNPSESIERARDHA